MTNEVTIHVTMADDTAAGRAAVKASWAETAATIPPIKVTATNPIDEAWQAQVDADIKAATPESVDVTFTANTEALQAGVEEAFAAIRAAAGEPLAIGPADAEAFQASALEAVQVTRAEIAAAMTPIEMPTVYATATRLDQSSGEDPLRALPPGMGVGMGPESFRPSYTPGPAFGPGGDPYAAARQAAQNMPPIEVPTRAANPIDDAFVAQVRSSVRGVAVDALQIPAVPEMEGFQAQLEEVLTELSATERANIPVDVGDAMIFREQVAELVAQVEQSVKAVIDVQVNNEGSLSDLQQKTVAASQASLDLVAAEQKLNQAMASGDDEQVAKARADVVAATKEDQAATQELAAAQAAAAEESAGLAAAEDVAAGSARGLGAAMGPLWMVMNVAQVAMMGFGFSSSTTSSQVQDASAQILALGQATGQTAQSLLLGNQANQQTVTTLNQAGTSAAAYNMAVEGGVASTQRYVNALKDQQSALGAQTLNLSTATKNFGQLAESGTSTTTTVADLADMASKGAVSIGDLSPAAAKAVTQFQALGGSGGAIAQAQHGLDALNAAAQVDQQVLASLGYTMTDSQKAYEQYGLGVQTAAKALSDAQAGSTYLENATDKASITAGQGVQQWQQLQQAVTSAANAYDQAANGVAAAEHGVETAQQGVASAIHAEQQAVLAVQTAQTAYTNSLYQEGQAQAAVTAARAAAEQQLISLQLQANDAATSVDNANLSLYNAQQNAGKYGVNTGNAQQIADTQNITAANAAQVQAAIQLVQAENALADAQNSSGQAQSSLNTARQQGVDNNPAVLSAEHALEQAQQAVTSAAQGVTNAQYAQTQAAQQVTNAEWSLQQASVAVGQAENAEATAATALHTAQDAASRSVDANTLAGAQNRQELEQLFVAFQNATMSTEIATAWTEKYGGQMGFAKTDIDNVLGSLQGLNGSSAVFSIEGVPSINPARLIQIGNEFHLDFAPMASSGGRAYAVGGPTGSGVALVGEQGPELVHLAPGSTVMPYANTQRMLKGYAAGGSVGSLDSPMAALQANMPLAASWGAYDVLGQTAHALGGPAINLPTAGSIDLGPFTPGGYGGGGGGSLAASSALAAQAQAYAASQLARHGWGQDQMPPLIKLWNQESGWNPYAVNPSSGAAGIPQALGHGNVFALGDIVGQVDWGEDYIAGRYGDPANAWVHEQAFNWYAGGGSAGGGLAMLGEHGPEIVSAGGGVAVAAQPQALNVTLSVGSGGDQGVATFIKYLLRSGMLQLQVSNGQVR